MEERNYCVYKHTSPSGKVYIGITCQEPEKRWRNGYGYYQNKHFTNAIQKYGWENFKHEILFTNLSKEEACQKEIELIAFYKSNQNEFGYNLLSGGEHGLHSEETCRQISESKKGCTSWNTGKICCYSEETLRKMSVSKLGHTPWNKNKIIVTKKSRKVICLETGKIYDSIKIAEVETGCLHISEVCNGTRKTTNGYTWRYAG